MLAKEKAEYKQPVLASAGSRLGAFIIDMLFLGIAFSIAMFVFILLLNMIPDMNYKVESIENGTVDLKTVQIFLIFFMFFGMQIFYLLVNGWLLHSKGQTIGKKLLSIKVVDAQNNKPSFAEVYFLRFLINQVLAFVPFYALIDALFIFREDKRCVHDLLPGQRSLLKMVPSFILLQDNVTQ